MLIATYTNLLAKSRNSSPGEFKILSLRFNVYIVVSIIPDFQDIYKCQGPLEVLNELNAEGRLKLAELRKLIGQLESLGKECSSVSERNEILQEVRTSREQLTRQVDDTLLIYVLHQLSKSCDKCSMFYVLCPILSNLQYYFYQNLLNEEVIRNILGFIIKVCRIFSKGYIDFLYKQSIYIYRLFIYTACVM